jgi:NDP-sugar pyrophosphorylase family protein
MQSPINEAVVLAGGVGSRLFPLTKHRPKPLVPICNYTMLDWNFFVLASNGITRVIVVVKYLGDQIREHISNYTSKIHPKMEIIIPEVNPKDTADALRVVSGHILTENFFVTMADIVTNINLKEMANFHLAKNGMATISLKSIVNHPKQFGVILLDDKSKILHFLEKPKPQELYLTTLIFQRRESISYHTNLINSGIYCFKKEILDILNGFKDLMDFGKNVFPFLLERKLGLFGYTSEIDYFWQDCGRPEQLLWTNWDVLKRWNWPYLPKGNEETGSWFGENRKLDKDVNIVNPIAIGNNVSIESGTKIDLSTINDGTHIGKNGTIKESIIWENVKIGDNVKIYRSIISDNVTIGNECVIDEGSIIASGQIIPAGSHITKGEVIE